MATTYHATRLLSDMNIHINKKQALLDRIARATLIAEIKSILCNDLDSVVLVQGGKIIGETRWSWLQNLRPWQVDQLAHRWSLDEETYEPKDYGPAYK